MGGCNSVTLNYQFRDVYLCGDGNGKEFLNKICNPDSYLQHESDTIKNKVHKAGIAKAEATREGDTVKEEADTGADTEEKASVEDGDNAEEDVGVEDGVNAEEEGGTNAEEETGVGEDDSSGDEATSEGRVNVVNPLHEHQPEVV